MGRNARPNSRRRGSRRRRRQEGAQPEETAATTRRKSGWRASLDAWGGPAMIGVVVAVLLAIGLMIVFRPSSAVSEISDEPLMGESFEITSTSHVTDASQLVIPQGRPPVEGPHFATPHDTGIYEEPVPDGNTIHSLEHGIVWFSYNPDQVSAEDLEVLNSVAEEFSNDVILAPRPENEMPIAAASWGQLLTLDEADAEVLSDFVRINRNRSPEPGLR